LTNADHAQKKAANAANNTLALDKPIIISLPFIPQTAYCALFKL
jgi:hypothetical protein